MSTDFGFSRIKSLIINHMISFCALQDILNQTECVSGNTALECIIFKCSLKTSFLYLLFVIINVG